MSWRCDHGPTVENTTATGRCRTCSRANDAKRRERAGKPTHCHRGHPLVPENTYVDTRGYRLCRQCRLLTIERYGNDPGGRGDVTRFRRWLLAWLEVNDTSGDALATTARISPRIVNAIRRGERKWIHLSTLDALLVATGNPELVGCFHALPGETLDPMPPLPRRPKPRAKAPSFPASCRSGDDCARPAGHGPNGRFCAEIHGPELDRIFAELNPKVKNQAEFNERRRKAFAQGASHLVGVIA